MKGAIYYVAIATVIFSHVEIPSFRGKSSPGIALVFCTGNHMPSSAIWDESAQGNFSKVTKLQLILWSLKNLRQLIYPKLHEKNSVITC